MDTRDLYSVNLNRVFVIEDAYRRHRLSVQRVRASTCVRTRGRNVQTIDRRRQLDADYKRAELARHNALLTERLSIIERGESVIAREKREHLKKVLPQLEHRARVSGVSSAHARLGVARENAFVGRRIAGVLPCADLVSSACESWYRPHERFLTQRGASRRTRLTGGHLMRVPQQLRPPSRARWEQSLSSRFGGAEDDEDDWLVAPQQEVGQGHDSYGADMFGERCRESEVERARRLCRVLSPCERGVFSFAVSAERRAASLLRQEETDRATSAKASASPLCGVTVAVEKSIIDMVSESACEETEELVLAAPTLDKKGVPEGRDAGVVQRWTFPLTDCNCVLEVRTLDRGDPLFSEMLLLRVVQKEKGILCERMLSIDVAHTMASAVHHMSSATTDSTARTRAVLRNVFHEMYGDRSGWLSYAELEELMQEVCLGLTSEEMRRLVAHADMDEHGCIDFAEFSAKASALVHTFRANALASRSGAESFLSDMLARSMSPLAVAATAGKCIDVLQQSDPACHGVLTANIIKRRLLRCTALDLSHEEVALLCQSLTRNASGLCVYESIRTVLLDVKLACVKAAVLDSRTRSASKEIAIKFDAAVRVQMEEQPDSYAVRHGNLPLRKVVDALLHVPHFPLSRLQVVKVVAKADVVHDIINVHAFLPVAAKYIEKLFDPTVMSSAAEEARLVGDEESVGPELRQRMQELFAESDTNHNGTLEYAELMTCINALGLGLSAAESKALVACAFIDSSDVALTLEQFQDFVMQNLAGLMRAKAEGTSNRVRSESIKAADEDDNVAFLKKMYLRLSADEETIDRALMEALLRTVVQPASLCFELLLCSFPPLVRSVPVEEAAAVHGLLLRECGYDTNAFLTHDSSLGRRSFMQLAAQSVVSESDLRERIEAVADKCGWMLEFSCENVCAAMKDEVWEVSSRGEEFWTALCDPCSMLTLLEATSVFLRCERLQRPVGRTELLEEMREAKKLLLFRDVVDHASAREVTDSLLAAFDAVHPKMSFGSQDQEDDALVSVEACFSVLAACTALRLSKLQAVFLVYWSEAVERDGSVVNWKQFVQYAAESVVNGWRNLDFLDTFFGLLSSSGWTDGLNQQQLADHFKAAPATLASDEEAMLTLRAAPGARFSDVEARLVLSAFSAERGWGAVDWATFASLGCTLCSCVLAARFAGQRLTLLRSIAYAEYDSMTGVSTLSLKKLAERVLTVLTVVRRDTGLDIVFPDLSCIERQRSVEEQVAEVPVVSCNSDFEFDLELPVQGHASLSSTAVRVRVTVVSSVLKSRMYASAVALTCEGIALPSPLRVPMPSALGVDSELAEKFVHKLCEFLVVDAGEGVALRLRGQTGELEDALSCALGL